MRETLGRIAVALLGLRLLALYVIPAFGEIITDFPNYYVAAAAVYRGVEPLDLYDPVWFEESRRSLGIDSVAAIFNYFTPFSALILYPLAWLAPLPARQVWTAVNLAALAGLIALSRGLSGASWLATFAIVLLAGDALGNNFTHGQFYIVLTVLILGAVAARHRWPWLSGSLLSLAVITKVFPVLWLLPMVMEKRWKAAGWTLIGVVAFTAAGIAEMGWEPHRIYVNEVFSRTIHGEIQDPYNIGWNTFQAFLRRALVAEPGLNPSPILDLPLVYFFLRPLISLAIVAGTSLSVGAAAHPLVSYGAIAGMVSLITPSQASYHQILFAPAVLGAVTVTKDARIRVAVVTAYTLMCSNYMGAMARFDSGPLMVLAFPRAYLTLGLWMMFLLSACSPRGEGGARAPGEGARKVPKSLMCAAILAVSLISCVTSWQRWKLDELDGAVMVDPASRGLLEVLPVLTPEGVSVSTLRAGGFDPPAGKRSQPALSPDGRFEAVETNENGNWDIAIVDRATGRRRILTTSRGNDLMPVFSADGAEVYFVSDRRRGYRFTALYRVRL